MRRRVARIRPNTELARSKWLNIVVGVAALWSAVVSFVATSRASLDRAFTDVDKRLHLPLLGHAALTQTAGNLFKVTIVYRALELELSVVMLGLISATFSLLPAFIAIPLGRYMDRGHDVTVCWTGTGIQIFAGIGFLLFPHSIASLFLFTALYGVGHILNIGASQIICVRSASTERRDFAFGNYMIANSIGHASGPMLLALSAVGTAHPPTGFLFAVCVGLAITAFAIAMIMRPALAAAKSKKDAPSIPLRDLVTMPGIPMLIVVGVITMTAVELAPVYLPVLGQETGITAFSVGLLLTMRSIASLISRIFYASLVRNFGRQPLFIASLTMSAAGFGAFALPLPVWVLYCTSAMLGFGIGLATTLSVTSLVNAAPPEARATVVSMRMFGNRVSQIILPALAGLLASLTGAAGVFAILAVALGIGSYAVRRDPKVAQAGR
jgi:MFS family permease